MTDLEISKDLALEKECDDLRSQVDSLNVGFNNCQKERDAFRDERNRLNQLWGDAQAQLAAAQTEVERLKAEKAVWVRRADKTWHEKHFTDQIEALQTQLAAAQGQALIEVMCARIKAADDAMADGDYMLDSDDCISVIRGTWKPPLLNDKPAAPQPKEPK